MTLHASTVARRLGAVLLVLVLASTAVHVIGAYTGHDTMYGLATFFELDQEHNLPTWFSSAILCLSALLLAVIATLEPAGSRWTRYWWGLSLIFLVLSLDEVASIHEKFNRPVRELLGIGASVYFAWLVPAIVMLLVLVLAYLRWFFSLPLKTRQLAALSGFLYVGGAVGLELLGGLVTSRLDGGTTYIAIATLEETLQMCGVLVWIYTLLDFVAARGVGLNVRFTS